MKQPILRAVLMRYFAFSSRSAAVLPGVTSAKFTLLHSSAQVYNKLELASSWHPQFCFMRLGPFLCTHATSGWAKQRLLAKYERDVIMTGFEPRDCRQ